MYDTCATIRRKIKAFLRLHSVTHATFLRAIAAAGGRRKFQNGQLTRFLEMKGARAGNTSGIYYSAYVFFEKIRVRDEKDKSNDRVVMEGLYPNGANTTEVRNRGWAPFGKRVIIDRYGRMKISD